jgi:ElaB/YqjD/DUF883 family membrane-anchored ribosome-binding protein
VSLKSLRTKTRRKREVLYREGLMFHHRSTEFDPRVSAIASHLRAIEKELGGIGKSASRRASAGASAAGSQIADAIGPILNEIVDRFGRGQRVAVDQALSFGDEAINVGARVGNDALERIATQAKNRPMATLAVAIGVGLLIGFAVRRS